MEKYPTVLYFVAARDHNPVYFDGVHALKHALHFAELARRQGFKEVSIGIGRG